MKIIYATFKPVGMLFNSPLLFTEKEIKPGKEFKS